MPDWMLRLDANTTQNESYVVFITLVNMTYQGRNSVFYLSIPGIVFHDRCYKSHRFYVFLSVVVFNFFP